MNLENDLSKKNKELLQEIGIKSENREYSKDEINLLVILLGIIFLVWVQRMAI